ncbi:MAG: ECF transporter S component [Oscillospiraceae bacterium]|nr:ECF transporter S component [Oscillospiraceae bacterium]
MPKNKLSVRRIVTDAVLIAICYALSFLSIKAWVIEISFKFLPVLLAALLFGTADGLIVGALGAFAEQMLSYGFTPTTLLWVLPVAAYGVLTGLCRKNLAASALPAKIVLFAAIGVVCSLLNTLAFYADSKLFGYYTFELIVLNGGWRLLKDAILTPVLGILALELAKRLRRAGVAREVSR